MNIYNLIEQYLDCEVLGDNMRTDQDLEDWHFEMADLYSQLRDTISDRKIETALPLTVERLASEGWQRGEGDRMIKYIGNDLLEWVIPTHYLYIFRNAKVKHYVGCAHVTIDGINTVARLKDALELAGIKEEE